MSPRPPFAGATVLLVDGNNLLHRLAGSADERQVRLLVARLRAALPANLQSVLVLDGHAAPGAPSRQRIGGALELRHAGRQTADELIVGLLAAQPRPAAVLVVTDDRALAESVHASGGRVERLAWLASLLEKGYRSAPDEVADDERPIWRPGRGATRKRGNPRRLPRRR